MTDTQARSRHESLRTTLLHRPAVPPGALEREELLEWLDAGLRCTATLVAAPAGYGKSVLASQWCQRADRAVVWMSLAPPVDGLRDYLRYLVAGIQTAVPGSVATTSMLVDSGEDPTEEAAITAVSNDLHDLSEPLVIVLDDYHLIKSPSVHRLMSELLRHPPQSAHFMFLSRRDPPWPIGSLRASGQLNELRMNDLRFTADESARLVGTELGRELDEREKLGLDASTEGWAAGLRLAVHAMRHGASANAVVGAAYLDRGTQEYLVAEVLDHLPSDMVRLLVAASYFDKFSAELCDAVVNTADVTPHLGGYEFVEWLQRENLFLVPLDDDGTWFRFHHVFRRLLGEWRTSHAGFFEFDGVEVHAVAAQLLRDQDLIEEAIGELALAGLEDDLVALASSRGNELINEDRWGDLATLLSAVPAEIRERHAALVVLQAWLVGEHGGRYREMVELLDRAEVMLDGAPDGQPGLDDLRGRIAVLRGTYARLNEGDLDGALDDARSAQHLLAEESGRILAQAYAVATMALANSGQYREARRVIDSAAGDERFAHWPTDPMLWTRPLLAWVEGNLDVLERSSAHLLEAGELHEQRAFIAYGRYFLGACAYERNELGTAREHLAVAVDVDYTIIELLLHSTIALALTELACGLPADALKTGAAMVSRMLGTRGDYNVPTAEAAMALLDHRTGRQAAALAWAHAAESDVPRHRYMFFDRTPALVEILLSSEPDVPRGRELLERTLASPYGTFNRPVNVKLLGLAAIDSARHDDPARALVRLKVAVDRAREGGLVRSIADLGTELVPLLHRLDVTGAELDHIGTILGAIEPLAEGRAEVGSGVQILSNVAGEPALTNREVDVLMLLAQRYSNKEISRELMIAPATVKKHTVTLYDKLNVHGRREAVEKARALGYIPT